LVSAWAWVLNFGLDRIYSFGDIAIISAFWLEIAYSMPFWEIFFLGGIFPLNDVTYHPNPQKAPPYAETRHLNHKA